MARPKDPNLERRLATTPPATVHQWPVHLRLLCSGRRFLDLVPNLEATNGRSVPSPTPAATPVRPAPPRPRSTPGRPATFPGRRDRTAPPDPTPLRFPAPTPMVGTPGRRTRQPPTPGGHAMIMLPSAVRIFLCTRPTDMRKSFDGLTGLVQECFAHDPPDRTPLSLRQPPQRPDQDPLFRSRWPGHLVQATRGRFLRDPTNRPRRRRRTPGDPTGPDPRGNRHQERTPTQAIPARRLDPEKRRKSASIDLNNMMTRL